MPSNFPNGNARPDPEQQIQEIVDEIRKRLPTNGVGGLALVALLALWLASGFYQVNPNEIGVVMRFGKVVGTTPPGLNWHLPAPIETVAKPAVTEVRKAEIGFRTLSPGPPARYRDVTEESRMLTADGNIVELDFVAQYRIIDPVKYLFNVYDPREALHDAAESAMRQVIGTSTIDSALTEGRTEIQERAQEILQNTLDLYESGLLVSTVKLQDVVPPGPVQDAFKDVINAEQDRERMINEAQGFANDILPKARGTAAQMLNEAEGYAEAIVKEAEGQAERFDLVRKEYVKAKGVTRKRLYLETMEDVLPGIEKFVIGGGAGGGPVPLLPLKPLGGTGTGTEGGSK